MEILTDKVPTKYLRVIKAPDGAVANYFSALQGPPIKKTLASRPPPHRTARTNNLPADGAIGGADILLRTSRSSSFVQLLC